MIRYSALSIYFVFPLINNKGEKLSTTQQLGTKTRKSISISILINTQFFCVSSVFSCDVTLTNIICISEFLLSLSIGFYLLLIAYRAVIALMVSVDPFSIKSLIVFFLQSTLSQVLCHERCSINNIYYDHYYAKAKFLSFFKMQHMHLKKKC